MKKNKVLCIGSAGKDIFFPMAMGDLKGNSKVEKMIDKVRQDVISPQICFTHGSKVYIKNRFLALGGCASNIAVGLAHLGNEVSILALTGGDSDGEWIKNIFQKEKVDTTLLSKIDKLETDISVIIVDEINGERTIFVNRDVGEYLQVKKDNLENSEWCFVGSLYGDDLVMKNIETICSGVDDFNMKLAYNPGQSNILANPNEVVELIKRSNLLFVNKDEAQQVIKILNAGIGTTELNKKTEEELLTILFSKTRKNAKIILTDGSRGAWCFDGDNFYFQEAGGLTVLDTTGAGDAFASGFFSTILQGGKIKEAMKIGSKNSSQVIEFYGAQEGLLYREDVLSK